MRREVGIKSGKVDLALEMQVLTFYAQRRDVDAGPRTAGRPGP